MAGFGADRYPEFCFYLLALLLLFNLIILAVVSATLHKAGG